MENGAHAPCECVERSCPVIKHLLKMVWNRKRINGLIMVEIFVSFIVLFVVLTATAYYISNYYKPLGYNIQDVWIINVNSRLPHEGYGDVRSQGLRQLELAMRDMPEIESVGWMYAGPYARSTWTNGRHIGGKQIYIEINRASDDIQMVLSIPLMSGRWFSPEDNTSTGAPDPAEKSGSAKSGSPKPVGRTPVVINELYAKLLFGSGDPIGKMPLDSSCRIVGVMKDFRKAGEFSAPVCYQIERLTLMDSTGNRNGSFYIHVKPGTTMAFQAKLSSVLESVEKGWSFHIEPLTREREADFKLRLAPLIAGGVIAIFLLLMVALGLIGVLWQNVSQRTKEIGLRRALGGTAQNVSWQIRGEQFAITTIGVAVGSFLVLQLPILDLIEFIPAQIYMTALVFSMILLYMLTYLCSMFPSWLAMDIEPAEALHYD